MQLFARPLIVGATLAGAAPAFAQLDNLAEQLRTTPITTQKIADNFHVLFGVGGNIIVSIGVNGTLIVDGQFPQMVPKYKAKIGELGGKETEPGPLLLQGDHGRVSFRNVRIKEIK